MKSKFVVGQRYPTRCGGEALVVGVDCYADRHVAAAFYDRTGRYLFCGACRPDGQAFYPHFADDGFDIIPPESREVWVNVWRDDEGSLRMQGLFRDRKEADDYYAVAHAEFRPRIGCHPITIRAEFEPEAAS